MREVEREIFIRDSQAQGAEREGSITLKQIDVIRNHYGNNTLADRTAAEASVAEFVKAIAANPTLSTLADRDVSRLREGRDMGDRDVGPLSVQDRAKLSEFEREGGSVNGFGSAQDAARAQQLHLRAELERDATDLNRSERARFFEEAKQWQGETRRLSPDEQARYAELSEKRENRPLSYEESVERARLRSLDDVAEIRYQNARIKALDHNNAESKEWNRADLDPGRRKELEARLILAEKAHQAQNRALHGISSPHTISLDEYASHLNEVRALNRQLGESSRKDLSSDGDRRPLEKWSTAAVVGAGLESKGYDEKTRRVVEDELERRYGERLQGTRSSSEFVVDQDAVRSQGRAVLASLTNDRTKEASFQR